MAKSESTKIEFGYFHDYESEQFAFYRIPKVLFTDEYFRNLSSDAKVLYGLMLDRMALSIRHQWFDEEGNWKNLSAESMRTIFLASCQMNAMRFLTDSILKNRKICRQKLQIWKLNYQVMKKVADQRRSLLLWLINTKILRN